MLFKEEIKSVNKLYLSSGWNEGRRSDENDGNLRYSKALAQIFVRFPSQTPPKSIFC